MNSKDFISELEFELVSTEKLLNRIPPDKLLWQPHPKARTLGELALHVARIPSTYFQYAKDGTTTVDVLTARQLTATKEEILSAFQKSKEVAWQILSGDFDSLQNKTWQLTNGSVPIFSLPVPFFTRLLVFNHWIHHRGELVMYLRTLDILIPSIYGPSADENPFG